MGPDGYSTDRDREAHRRFLQVNVYYSGGGWVCAVFLKRHSGPVKRSMSHVGTYRLPSGTQSMQDALEAAAEVLREEAGLQTHQ